MSTPVIFVRQFAEVARRLIEQGVTANDPHLKVKFLSTWQIVLGGSVAQRASQLRVDLPDLDDRAIADIVKDNVSALAALYFAAQLEDLKFFSVADKVTEQFLSGLIPVSRSEGGGALYNYYRTAEDRFSEHERRGMYARAFGFAQGSVDEPLPNREFGDLWIRFCSSVSIYNRELELTGERRKISEQELSKNARDLAVNLSVHGYGIAHFAAIELQDTIKGVLKTLAYPEVLQAYGVLDVWQLIERVSGMHLGGAANSVRQRALATSGSRIILWLADKAKNLSGLGGSVLVQQGGKYVVDPKLVQEVDRWLAVTGTGEDTTNKFSEPVSISAQPTIPDMALRAAPDLFQDAMNLVNGANGASLAKA